jgi:hypothetical protein
MNQPVLSFDNYLTNGKNSAKLLEYVAKSTELQFGVGFYSARKPETTRPGVIEIAREIETPRHVRQRFNKY